MIIKRILNYLEQTIPLRYACSWDNSGLQVGHSNQDIKRVYVALDATEEVVNDAIAKECDMIITHHPLLFSAIKQITGDTSTGRKLLALLRNDVAVYSAHTSFDAVPGGMGDLTATLLQLRGVTPLEPMNGPDETPWGIGVVGNLPAPMSLQEFCDLVKGTFRLEHVNVFPVAGMENRVLRVAICPGSGRSMFDAVEACGADVFLSGDIGHHEGIDLVDMGCNVVDAGHHGLEKIFVPFMAENLRNAFPEIEVCTAKAAGPFIVY